MTPKEKLNKIADITTDAGLDNDTMLQLVRETLHIKEEQEVIEIPLSEYDVEELLPDTIYNNETVTWSFPTKVGGVETTLIFMSEDEHTQRGN